MSTSDSEAFPEPPPPITRQPWFKWALATVVLGLFALMALVSAAIYFLVQEDTEAEVVLPEHREALITLSDLREVFPDLEVDIEEESFNRWGGTFFVPELNLLYSLYDVGEGALYIDSEVVLNATAADAQWEWSFALESLQDEWDWLTEEGEPVQLSGGPLPGVGDSAHYAVVWEEGEPTGCSLFAVKGRLFLSLDLYGQTFESTDQAAEFLRAQLDKVELGDD